jgi:hypothetical protein
MTVSYTVEESMSQLVNREEELVLEWPMSQLVNREEGFGVTT